MRAVRIARSVGRPSRLKKPAGDLAPAYMRSSTSTVSGKNPALARLHPALGRGEDHRVSRADDDGAVSLLGQLARLEGDLLAADLDVHRRGRDLQLSYSQPSALPVWVGEGGFESAAGRRGGGSLKLPPRGSRVAGAAQVLHESAVALEVELLHVVQEPAPLAHQLQQPTTGMSGPSDASQVSVSSLMRR